LVFLGAIGIDYGKSDLPTLRLRKRDVLRGASDVNQVVNEVVKSDSNIVDSFSSKQRNNCGHRPDADEIMLAQLRDVGKLRIWLDSNLVRLTIQELSDFPIQVLDVLVGPCSSHSNKIDALIGS